MNFSRFLGFCLISACAFGCVKDGDISKDAAGNCTRKFIDDYNYVVGSFKATGITCSSNGSSSNACTGALKGIEEKCTIFKATHATSVACTAQEEGGGKMEAHATTIYSMCSRFTSASNIGAAYSYVAELEKRGNIPDGNIRVKVPSCEETAKKARKDKFAVEDAKSKVAFELFQAQTDKITMQNDAQKIFEDESNGKISKQEKKAKLQILDEKYFQVKRNEKKLNEISTCLDKLKDHQKASNG